jgi:Ornithine/acetylornithine aminotransferase
MKTNEYIALEEKYGAHNYQPLDVVLTRGEGVWVYDVEGKRYLDCLSAYSAVNQGHVHPKILQALVDQASKITLTSRAFRNDQLPLLYKELADLSGYEMSMLMNSGAEAVETALKLARKWSYQVKGVPRHKAEIIAAAGNFHGRTISLVSFSTEPLYKDDFGPFTPGFITVPYGDAAAIEKAITPNTAAVILEPIQGEGGVIIPPEGYLRQVSQICARHNILYAPGTMSFSWPMKCRPDWDVPASFLLANTRMSARISPSSGKLWQADFIRSRPYWRTQLSSVCSDPVNTAQPSAEILLELPLPVHR